MKSVNIDAAKLLAHQPPMRLINTLQAVSEISASAEALITPDNIFLENNTLHPSGLLECMAQTIAAFWGYQDMQSGGNVRIGYLVGIDKTEFFNIPVTPGDRIEITVEEIGSTGDFGAFQCLVEKAGKPVCRGVIKVLSERS